MTIISAIVAMAENRVIGKNNQLPWHLPADLKHFKDLTTGHPIIMGRKTYASIGKALPNRTNIIVSRNPNLQAPGCVITTSLADAINHASAADHTEMFIIGGAEIFKQSLELLQRLYLTILHQDIEGDTYFPLLEKQKWHEVERKHHKADAKNCYNYSFIRLEQNHQCNHK